MYKIFYSLLVLIWIGDILNIPLMFFNYLDTVLPINALAWLLIWLCLPSTKNIMVHSIDCREDEE